MIIAVAQSHSRPPTAKHVVFTVVLAAVTPTEIGTAESAARTPARVHSGD